MAHEPLDHVAAHAAQADHRELHFKFFVGVCPRLTDRHVESSAARPRTSALDHSRFERASVCFADYVSIAASAFSWLVHSPLSRLRHSSRFPTPASDGRSSLSAPGPHSFQARSTDSSLPDVQLSRLSRLATPLPRVRRREPAARRGRRRPRRARRGCSAASPRERGAGLALIQQATQEPALIASAGEALNVFDFEPVARKKHSARALGLSDDRHRRRRDDSRESRGLRPLGISASRRLVDVSKIDPSVEMLGVNWDTPIVHQSGRQPEGVSSGRRNRRGARGEGQRTICRCCRR